VAYLPKLNENGAAAPSFFSSVEDANGLLPRPNENVLAGVSVADAVKVDLLE